MKFLSIYKQEILSLLIGLLCFILLSFGVSWYLIYSYKKSFIQNNAYVLNQIVLEHPELEQEVIEAIQSKDRNYDLTLLEKYGFDDINALSYIDFVSQLEHRIYSVVFFSFSFFFFLVIVFVFLYFVRKERRIREIQHYLYRVLQNDYQEDLHDYREDSISSLKNDLVKVTNKLRNMSELSLEDKKSLERMLSDISHQLRTPLTSLSITNEVLGNEKLSSAERKAFLSSQQEQLDRMEWLVVSLLKMSQIDSGTITFSRHLESILNIVTDAFKPLLISMELKNICMEIEIPKNLVCSLDFSWTVEALGNILKNAIEHTNRDGMIRVEANDNPLYVEIIIQDNGEGIDKKDLKHIFERFYKGKEKSDSIGIGLNLSKTIIEKQDGTIHVDSEIGKGTKFIIHFYKVTV